MPETVRGGPGLLQQAPRWHHGIDQRPDMGPRAVYLLLLEWIFPDAVWVGQRPRGTGGNYRRRFSARRQRQVWAKLQLRRLRRLPLVQPVRLRSREAGGATASPVRRRLRSWKPTWCPPRLFVDRSVAEGDQPRRVTSRRRVPRPPRGPGPTCSAPVPRAGQAAGRLNVLQGADRVAVSPPTPPLRPYRLGVGAAGVLVVAAVRPVADRPIDYRAPRRNCGAVRRSCAVSPSAVVRERPSTGLAPRSRLTASQSRFSRTGASTLRRRGRIHSDSVSASESWRAVLEPLAAPRTAAPVVQLWRAIPRRAASRRSRQASRSASLSSPSCRAASASCSARCQSRTWVVAWKSCSRRRRLTWSLISRTSRTRYRELLPVAGR